MKNNATPYILNAIAIILNNIAPLIILLALSLIALLPTIQETPDISFIAVTSIMMMAFYPLVFGQYSEITLNNRQVAYSLLFKNHWFNFIVANIILNVPSMILDILRLSLGIDITYLEFVCSVFINSAAIYVFPLVFIKQQKWQSVKFGIQCALGNFKFSLPLMLLAVAPLFLGFFMGITNIEPGQYFNTFIYACFLIISLSVDFIVFVSATLILNEKLLTH